MSTSNVVRFRVKPGKEDRFLDAHRHNKANWSGLSRGVMIKTGELTYCLIGEWADADPLGQARGKMVATLDGFRKTLEDQVARRAGPDAASVPAVLALI